MSPPNGGIAESDIGTVAGDRLARRNALILAVAQTLAGANGWVVFGTASIVGSVLGPDRSLATVPISTFIVGMWAGTLPTAAIARRYGRRTAFEVGAFCGILAGLLCTAAIVQNSFALLCAGTMLGGFYGSAQQSYRFAAADTASKAFKPKAIAWVLAGGVFGAVLGAQLIIFTKDLWTAHLFAASYLAQASIAALAAVLLSFVRIPIPLAVGPTGAGRPLSEIMRQPRLIAAIVSGAMSYAMMNMVMTAAPLAMVNCSYSVTDANLGLQWHVIAMYAPSFFTGTLIARFGTERVVGVGLLLMASAALVGLSGISMAHFWGALVLLGIGWNLGFVGATTMVTDCHRPAERNKVQAINDFFVFGSMSIGSFSSGQLLAHFGWALVNQVVLPVLLGVAILLACVTVQVRRQDIA